MKILVVEDDRLLNNTLCYNLSTTGFAVDSAVSKKEAEHFCEKQEYDLIILDINLPDGNGFDFCHEIKECRPDTAVIFLTARDMESDQLRGFELGADDYVTKPFPMSVFRKKLPRCSPASQNKTVGTATMTEIYLSIFLKCLQHSRDRPLYLHLWNTAF